jgi:hypothetical protein
MVELGVVSVMLTVCVEEYEPVTGEMTGVAACGVPPINGYGYIAGI